MKNICLITHHPFWSEPLGCGTLIRARYQLLKKLCDEVFVLFITSGDNKCPLPGGTLNLQQQITEQDLLSIKSFLKKQNVNTCYFSYDQFGFLTEVTDCKNIVEIHDVMHLREAQFNKFGYDAPYKVNKTDELKSLQRYDHVVSLNINEVDYLRENNIGGIIYLPPNMNFNEIKSNHSHDKFGLIGSMAKPNVDGFKCLSKSLTHSNNFVIAGPLSLNEDTSRGIGSETNKLGLVDNPLSFYEEIGVALSPVRFGGGLKIKVFEALSFSKPVLATTHSVEGFPSNIEEVVTIVDDIKSWTIDTIKSTSMTKPSLIKEFFLEHFGEQKCADILKNIL